MPASGDAAETGRGGGAAMGKRGDGDQGRGRGGMRARGRSRPWVVQEQADGDAGISRTWARGDARAVALSRGRRDVAARGWGRGDDVKTRGRGDGRPVAATVAAGAIAAIG